MSGSQKKRLQNTAKTQTSVCYWKEFHKLTRITQPSGKTWQLLSFQLQSPFVFDAIQVLISVHGLLRCYSMRQDA
jgi:hypothetical protein